MTGGVARLGYMARFLGAILWQTPMALRRVHLTVREIYFSGVLSLVIILMSGLFVGMVLALQGYEVLQRYGAEEQLGIVVALSLVRELGTGDRRSAVCEPRRFRDHRRDRTDEGYRAAVGDGDDGGRPDRARYRAAVLGRA